MGKYRWEDRERMASTRSAGLAGHTCWFLAAIFAVLGIIGDAINATIGLEPLSWFLLAGVVALLSIPFYMGLGLGWYLTEKK